MKTLILEGIVTALNQISHNGVENGGNVQSFRKEKVQQPDGRVCDVPVISGNSIRGILRDLGAAQMLNKLGTDEENPFKVNLHTFQMLFSGGSLSSAKGAGTDIEKIKELRQTVPLLSLLGTANGNNMLPGKVQINPLLPICLENLHRIPIDFHPEKPVTCYKLLQVMTQTRKEDTQNPKLEKYIDKSEFDKVPTTQMLYSIETLAAGTQFYWKVVLKDVTLLEFDTFVTLLEEFRKNPSIGGKSAVGFGSIDISALKWTEINGGIDSVTKVTSDADSLYNRMIIENKDQIGGFLKTLA